MKRSVRSPKKRRTVRDRPAFRRHWVERTLKKMSLREKLGQMLMVDYFGAFASADSPEYQRMLEQIAENHVGGLILGTARGPLGISRSQLYPTAILTNELQKRAKIPLIVGADFESGTRMRLAEGTSIPSHMAIGATGDPKLAYEAGKVTALEARAAGVHWIFAPDVDVNNNPDNPIINVRSFGENPQSVAEYVSEFVRGIEENGALATAKHFPGHGNVTVDSHLSLPVVKGSRDELERTELAPFRAAIAAHVSSIMPGHLAVPAFEPDGNTPATLSRAILSGVLRREMKFHGLIITDALEMGGVASAYPPGEIAVRAVDAGADVLLMPPHPKAAIAVLEDAVQSGRVPLRRIDESVRRILEAKSRLGLDQKRVVDVPLLYRKFGCPLYRAQALSIADKGITLLRDSSRFLPLDSTRPTRLLLVALSADPDSLPAETLEEEIRPRVDSLTVLRADARFCKIETLTLPAPDSYDIAIAAIFVRVADRKGNVGFPEEQRAFVNRLLANGKPTAVVAFGSPYLIERFPTAKTWLGAFSTNEVTQRAVARGLFGQVSIAGKIPVTVPGCVKRGDGMRTVANPMTFAPASAEVSSRLQTIYELLDRAIKSGAFPGGVLGVGWDGELAVHPFGRLTRDAKGSKVAPDTIYDVASLTKPIITATALMMLYEQKLLDLDAPVERYLPEFGCAAVSDPNPAWRSSITVGMLMLHDAGLPAHRDFYNRTSGKHGVLARVAAEPLVREPGKEIEYSDLGFILLGAIAERLTGISLDEFARENILKPLGMHHSLFNPLPKMRARIAPTEHDREFRRRLIHGEVHDENAWTMGGVAGHAGLFSTAGDIAIFAQMMLNGGIFAHRRILNRATIKDFTTRRIVGDSAAALGWDVPTEPSSSGHYFSTRSYGHLGFTGTSVWIDPDRKLFVVLLTNRIHPTRTDEQIRQVRPLLHDTIAEALDVGSGRAVAR
jgi:beta-N-acetylhexosaminidase